MDVVDPPNLAEQLRQDLLAFADPGTAVDVTSHGHELTATWSKRGRERREQYRFTDTSDLGDVRVLTSDGDIPYSTFLAGDRMADLRAVARNTLNVLEEIVPYVAPRSGVEGEAREEQADLAVRRLVTDTIGQTSVVFLSADAGVGKTTLLTQLTRRVSSGYLDGSEAALWLYVNAQGSRLARLDQAIAATLDDVRAEFPYHATTALVRAGALVLVVDGFDELLGTPGTYDEAFSSLASFITSLRGCGSLVAAARSAYYEQEFRTRASRNVAFQTEPWRLRVVSLRDWNAAERQTYLEQFSARTDLSQPRAERLVADVQATFADPHLAALAGKPLFVSRVANLLAEGRTLEVGGDLVERLISTYMLREANERLLSAQRQPLLTVDQLRGLYIEIADEMWHQETRELSRSSIRELVEIFAEAMDLGEDARAIVVERIPYSALMRAGSGAGSVAFEHELYFSFFLVQPVVLAVASGDPRRVGRELRKGRLPSQAGQLAGRALLSEDSIQPHLDLLAEAAGTVSQGGEQVRQNSGRIVVGMLDDSDVAGLRIHGIDFVDCDLSHVVFRGCDFQSVAFLGVDLSSTIFEDCTANGVTLESVTIDGVTRLDIRGLGLADVGGLVVFTEDGAVNALYAPAEVQQALLGARLPAAATAPAIRHVHDGAIRVVAAIAHAFERTNLITLEDNQALRRTTRDPYWYDTYEALIGSGVAREETRQAGGRHLGFIRMLVRPADLLAGQALAARVDERITRFWELLEARAPEA